MDQKENKNDEANEGAPKLEVSVGTKIEITGIFGPTFGTVKTIDLENSRILYSADDRGYDSDPDRHDTWVGANRVSLPKRVMRGRELQAELETRQNKLSVLFSSGEYKECSKLQDDINSVRCEIDGFGDEEWRQSLHTGMKCAVLDPLDRWADAEILGTRRNYVRIKYRGYPERWNQELSRSDDRLRKCKPPGTDRWYKEYSQEPWSYSDDENESENSSDSETEESDGTTSGGEVTVQSFRGGKSKTSSKRTGDKVRIRQHDGTFVFGNIAVFHPVMAKMKVTYRDGRDPEWFSIMTRRVKVTRMKFVISDSNKRHKKKRQAIYDYSDTHWLGDCEPGIVELMLSYARDIDCHFLSGFDTGDLSYASENHIVRKNARLPDASIVLGNIAIRDRKMYFEFNVREKNDEMWIGLTDKLDVRRIQGAGIVNHKNIWAYCDGYRHTTFQFGGSEEYAEPEARYQSGDTIGIFVDPKNCMARFYKNGTLWNETDTLPKGSVLYVFVLLDATGDIVETVKPDNWEFPDTQIFHLGSPRA